MDATHLNRVFKISSALFFEKHCTKLAQIEAMYFAAHS